MNFPERYETYRSAVESALEAACAAMNFQPAILAESMHYSLLAGGKRIRPVLFLATLDSLCCDYLGELKLAVAIECIHTYSLIHDDLPAIDNDDFRRGMPSSHRKFGEGNAVLAGDALLSYAFDLLLEEAGRSERHRAAARVLSRAAGAEGMLAGQSADLYFANREAGEEELLFIHENKTARLIAAPIVMAATLAGKYSEGLGDFGRELGFLFQLTDDILDGSNVGSDDKEGKLTALKVYGAKRAEEIADERVARCHSLLRGVENTEFFEEIVSLVRKRTN